MMNPNDVTLDTYNSRVNLYIQNTPKGYAKNHKPLLNWISTSLEMLPLSSKVLEIGSGTGREARFIQSKGFEVVRSDGAHAFVQYLNKLGEPTVLLNVLKDDIRDEYGMIFANAVIPHFTPDDLSLVLKKIRRSLKPNGLFAFSAKQGDGEMWITEKLDEKRYVRLWQSEELKALIVNSGYELVFLEDNIPGDIPSHTWINLTARRTG